MSKLGVDENGRPTLTLTENELDDDAIAAFQQSVADGEPIDSATAERLFALFERYQQMRPSDDRGRPSEWDYRFIRCLAIERKRLAGTTIADACQAVARDENERKRILNWYRKGKYQSIRKTARVFAEYYFK